jgi:hypothetical protein
MPSRPSIIDADGHILDRQSDIHRYLEPPWNRRPVNLWPSEPWDTELFGTRDRGEAYSRKMTPEQQVNAWLRVMDQEGMETAVCFPGLDGKAAEASAALSRSSPVNAFWISSTSRDSKKGSPHWLHTHAGMASQDT